MLVHGTVTNKFAPDIYKVTKAKIQLDLTQRSLVIDWMVNL
jgi:hypothetical protein